MFKFILVGALGFAQEEVVLDPVVDQAPGAEYIRSSVRELIGRNHKHHWKNIPSFVVTEGSERCFYEFVPEHIHFAAAYIGNTEELGFDCHANIVNDEGLVVSNKLVNSQNTLGLISHKADVSGQYKICLKCDKSSWIGKNSAMFQVKIELLNDVSTHMEPLGVNKFGYDNNDVNHAGSQSADMATINKNLGGVLRDLEIAIEVELQEKSNENNNFEALEKTKWLIKLMGGVSIVCTAVSMVLVVQCLKKFFRREKVI